MEFPLEIGFGNAKLSAHLLFETLAFVLGYQYYQKLRAKSIDAINDSNRLWIIIGAAFGAFFFSRLIGVLEAPTAWKNAAYPLLSFFRSKTIVGGLLGGLLGVELVKYLIGEKHSSGDLFTFPIILGMMIGRIGCFSSGVYEPTFGIPTTLPWGMNLGDDVLRHPVALYEIIWLGLTWWLLRNIQHTYSLKSGYIFQFFMITYLIFRFFLEWIKPNNKLFLELTAIQITCLLGLLYYYKTIFKLIFNPKKLIIDE